MVLITSSISRCQIVFYFMLLIVMLSEIQDAHGNKMINEYVRERKIGTGSYGKVVSNFEGNFVFMFILRCQTV
jgi:nickel-dependent lactate racemase